MENKCQNVTVTLNMGTRQGLLQGQRADALLGLVSWPDNRAQETVVYHPQPGSALHPRAGGALYVFS